MELTTLASLTLTFQTGERQEDTIMATINAINIGELFTSGGLDTNLGATATAGGGATGGGAIDATAATASSQEYLHLLQQQLELITTHLLVLLTAP